MRWSLLSVFASVSACNAPAPPLMPPCVSPRVASVEADAGHRRVGCKKNEAWDGAVFVWDRFQRFVAIEEYVDGHKDGVQISLFEESATAALVEVYARGIRTSTIVQRQILRHTNGTVEFREAAPGGKDFRDAGPGGKEFRDAGPGGKEFRAVTTAEQPATPPR